MIAVVLVLLAPFLIPFVYGHEYLSSIALAYPLIISMAIVSLGVGIGPVFRTLKLMKEAIISNAVFILLGTIVLFFSAKFLSITTSVYFIALWLPIVTLFQFYYLLHKIDKINSEA